MRIRAYVNRKVLPLLRLSVPSTILVCMVLALGGMQPVRSQQVTTGQLEITLLDTTGQPTPVRVRLTQRGQVVNALPAEATALMYGLWDHPDGYGFQPDSAFYVNGYFRLALPPGDYILSLSKGLEYLDQQHRIHIEAGKLFRQTYRMKRWIHMPRRGWYSTDNHIHIRRSPREDPLLMDWLQAENVNVGVLLRMGDFWETYFPQYAWGAKGVYQQGDFLLSSGQEDPRTPELGHALGLGASDKVRYPEDYYYYDKVFDQLHTLGGVTGYAHQGETFHGYRGLTLDGLRNKIDVLELLQYCASADPLHTRHYYHLLDLGYRVTAVAGSDFPWCGQDHDNGTPERTARIGNVRFYSYLNGPLTFNNWRAALQAGHTFVTSGPMLDLKVNQALPGDVIRTRKGDLLSVSVHAYGHTGQVPLQRLELISHGQIIGTVEAGKPGQSASHLVLNMKIRVKRGIWLAARCYAGPGQVAHTTPVYISADGSGFHNPATAPMYLELSELYLRELEHELEHVQEDPERQAWRYREGLLARIAEVRKRIEELRKELK